MKLPRPYDSPDSALRALEELRGPEPPYSYNIPRRAWLRKALTMRERRLSHEQQITAVENRIKLLLVQRRLTKP